MKTLLLLAVNLAVISVHAQDAPLRVELLWPEGAPGAVGNQYEDWPSITVYLPEPEKAAGTGIVVCPGGGYGQLSMDLEGVQIAKWLNGRGVAAFVLKYRLGPRYHHPAQLQDAQRALRMVRYRAKDFGVAANRIGIMGFSAGGHLASTAGTHFDSGNPAAPDHIECMSSRPDFMVLAYPVISFTTPHMHQGSMRNLLGDHPGPELVKNLSNELQVTPETPPTFLFSTDEDKTVPAENSVLFYLALRKAGVPAEMHIFQHGQHGVGLAQNDPDLSAWPTLLEHWLRLRGLLGK